MRQSDGKHFGQRLREARVAAGLSQSELEDISGIPKARLSRYENGHVEPSIQTLARLSRALNVSEASLLGDQRAILEDFFTKWYGRAAAPMKAYHDALEDAFDKATQHGHEDVILRAIYGRSLMEKLDASIAATRSSTS